MLREQGYLDDARFARQFAEDKRLLDEWGADRIERRLRRSASRRSSSRDAVGARGHAGELEAAQVLLRRRFPQLGDEPRERRRALGVLVRKGYDSELAWDAIRAHARAARRVCLRSGIEPRYYDPAQRTTAREGMKQQQIPDPGTRPSP